MQHTRPPFRADHVGSFLRTAPIKDARAKRDKGEITAEQLKAVEDAEIKKIIARQEECGLQLVTDGEFRRSWWHFDFLTALDGVEMKQIDHGIQFAGVQTKAERPDVVGKVGFTSHPMIDHFKFLKANTRVVAEDDDPVADAVALPLRPPVDQQDALSRPRPVLRRPRKDLRQGGEGVLRRGLPLPAVR